MAGIHNAVQRAQASSAGDTVGSGECEMSDEWIVDEKDMLLHVAGSKIAFRCECGCNVFRKGVTPGTYICNGCRERYFTEEYNDQKQDRVSP